MWLNYNVYWPLTWEFEYLIPGTVTPSNIIPLHQHKEISFDIMFTLFRTNPTQIDTSRQCMLKAIHVTTVGHVSNHLTVIATSSAFVSDVVTWCFCWLVSTSKVITLCFWLPKIIFLPTCFCLNFSICTSQIELFLLPTCVDKYYFHHTGTSFCELINV